MKNLKIIQGSLVGEASKKDHAQRAAFYFYRKNQYDYRKIARLDRLRIRAVGVGQ